MPSPACCCWRPCANTRSSVSEESGEAEECGEHATFFLAMAEEAHLKLRGSRAIHVAQRLEAEHDNLRAALRWTLKHQEVEMGLRLAGALLDILANASTRVKGEAGVSRCWRNRVPGAHGGTSEGALAAGAMEYFQGDFPEAQAAA